MRAPRPLASGRLARRLSGVLAVLMMLGGVIAAPGSASPTPSPRAPLDQSALLSQVVPGVSPVNGQISTQFSKSYNDLATIFFTFGTPEFTPVHPWERQRNETNAFFYPSRSEEKTRPGTGRIYLPLDDRIEAQVHIGSKVMPQYPTRPLAEMGLRLMHAAGLTASAEGIAIHPSRYRNDRFILAFDCERAGSDPSSVSYTRINTAVGNATIRLEMKGINAYPGNPARPFGSQVVDRVYCHIVHSMKMNIVANGVTVSE